MDEFVDSTPEDVEAWLGELAEMRRHATAADDRAFLRAIDPAEVEAREYLDYVGRAMTEFGDQRGDPSLSPGRRTRAWNARVSPPEPTGRRESGLSF